jgi:hypothetical protein
MKLKETGTAALLTACFVCMSFAEVRPAPRSTVEPQSLATEKSTTKNEIPAAAIRKSSDTPVTPTGNSEVFLGIFIDAGKTASLDSTLDYSSATSVAVMVQCIVCDSQASSLGVSGLVLLARWTVPGAELYVTPESKVATTFVYWDSGGTIFNVYGSQFRLSLQNKGTNPIAIEQVTLLRRGS